MEPKVKTADEHREYIRELCRISFFFAYRWRLSHPTEAVSAVLRQRTPLFHHALNLMHNEGESHPRWQELLVEADAVAERVAEAAAFEDAMFDYLRDFADARADRFYAESVGVAMPPDWNVRSLKYDPPKETQPPGYCTFHIANALAPRSILDEPDHLRDCFLELMDRSEAEYGSHTLCTSSWLNDHPGWLALFPQEWHDNLGPRSTNVQWHFGFWGQLANARGTFNHRAGRYVREHDELKYRTRDSHCSFRAMREHLEWLSRSLSAAPEHLPRGG